MISIRMQFNEFKSDFRSIKNTYGSIKVNVRGIEIMNDDPSSVRVLYAKIESESLQSLADGVLRQFVHSGFFFFQ